MYWIPDQSCGGLEQTSLADAGRQDTAQRQDHTEATSRKFQVSSGQRRGDDQITAEEEEEDSGEKARQESRQNLVGHLAFIHHHMDPVQYSGAPQTAHHGPCVHSSAALGLLLLSVLYQQHHQPSLLCPVQRVFSTDLRSDFNLQVAQQEQNCHEPRVLQLTRMVTKTVPGDNQTQMNALMLSRL